MAKQKVTMKDIAKAANVSVATVSYVLNYSEKELLLKPYEFLLLHKDYKSNI